MTRVFWLVFQKVLCILGIGTALMSIPFYIVPLYEPHANELFGVSFVIHVVISMVSLLTGILACNRTVQFYVEHRARDRFPSWLQEMVGEVAKRAGVSHRFTLCSDYGTMNVSVAADTRGHGIVCFSGNAHCAFTKDECEIVLAHEMAHVRAHDAFAKGAFHALSTVYVTYALLILTSWNVLAMISLFGLWSLHRLCYAKLSRVTEHLADMGALHILGKDRQHQLVSALSKLSVRYAGLERVDTPPSLFGPWDRMHPLLEERVRILKP